MVWTWIKLGWWLVVLSHLLRKSTIELGGVLAACGMTFSTMILAYEQFLKIVEHRRARRT